MEEKCKEKGTEKGKETDIQNHGHDASESITMRALQTEY